jgi:excisionase family DNA binding protein
MDTQLLTPDEAAARLRVTRETILKWCRLGSLPAVRLGLRTVRIRPADLEKFEHAAAQPLSEAAGDEPEG